MSACLFTVARGPAGVLDLQTIGADQVFLATHLACTNKPNMGTERTRHDAGPGRGALRCTHDVTFSRCMNLAPVPCMLWRNRRRTGAGGAAAGDGDRGANRGRGHTWVAAGPPRARATRHAGAAAAAVRARPRTPVGVGARQPGWVVDRRELITGCRMSRVQTAESWQRP